MSRTDSAWSTRRTASQPRSNRPSRLDWHAAKLVRGARIGPATARRFASTRETVLEAAARLGISESSIRARIAHGWTEEQALSLPKFSLVKPRTKTKYGARAGVKPSPFTGPAIARRFATTRETVLEAAARLGISDSAIRARIAYGWTEEQALSLPKFSLIKPRMKTKYGARPGVKLSPLTRAELVILRCLADGITPREIHASGLGKSVHALHQHMDRMRLKLDAFTTVEMVAIAIRRGIIG